MRLLASLCSDSLSLIFLKEKRKRKKRKEKADLHSGEGKMQGLTRHETTCLAFHFNRALAGGSLNLFAEAFYLFSNQAVRKGQKKAP